MCCFSSDVSHVSSTQIFARGLPEGRQALAYAMTIAAPTDVAMVLPIPVPDGAREDAVRFIALDGYDTLFDDLARAFPSRPVASGFGPPVQYLSLTVHAVGDYVASFVPSARDFARLDPRFRLPTPVLDAFADAAFGFVVFALAGVSSSPEARHPMAFTFPRRDPAALFFPTLHVHHGSMPVSARFDHTLYAQLDHDVQPADLELDHLREDGTRFRYVFPWHASDGVLASYVDAVRARGVVDPGRRAYAVELSGELANADTYALAR